MPIKSKRFHDYSSVDPTDYEEEDITEFYEKEQEEIEKSTEL